MTRTIWLSGQVWETPSPRCGQTLRDSVTDIFAVSPFSFNELPCERARYALRRGCDQHPNQQTWWENRPNALLSRLLCAIRISYDHPPFSLLLLSVKLNRKITGTRIREQTCLSCNLGSEFSKGWRICYHVYNSVLHIGDLPLPGEGDLLWGWQMESTVFSSPAVASSFVLTGLHKAEKSTQFARGCIDSICQGNNADMIGFRGWPLSICHSTVSFKKCPEEAWSLWVPPNANLVKNAFSSCPHWLTGAGDPYGWLSWHERMTHTAHSG